MPQHLPDSRYDNLRQLKAICKGGGDLKKKLALKPILAHFKASVLNLKNAPKFGTLFIWQSEFGAF